MFSSGSREYAVAISKLPPNATQEDDLPTLSGLSDLSLAFRDHQAINGNSVRRNLENTQILVFHESGTGSNCFGGEYVNESEGLKAIRVVTKMTIMLILPSAPILFNHHKLDDGSDKDSEHMRRKVMKRGEEEKEPPPAGSVPLKLCPPRPWSTGSKTGSPAAGP